MSKNILITESQYARIFLGESYVNPDCVKRYSCGNNKTGCWTHSTQAPYWFTLKDPFNDGFDYQWRFMDDCVRRWIRRDKNYRGEGVDLYSKNLDMTIGKDKNQIFVDQLILYLSCQIELQEYLTPHQDKEEKNHLSLTVL